MGAADNLAQLVRRRLAVVVDVEPHPLEAELPAKVASDPLGLVEEVVGDRGPVELTPGNAARDHTPHRAPLAAQARVDGALAAIDGLPAVGRGHAGGEGEGRRGEQQEVIQAHETG